MFRAWMGDRAESFDRTVLNCSVYWGAIAQIWLGVLLMVAQPSPQLAALRPSRGMILSLFQAGGEQSLVQGAVRMSERALGPVPATAPARGTVLSFVATLRDGANVHSTPLPRPHMRQVLGAARSSEHKGVARATSSRLQLGTFG